MKLSTCDFIESVKPSHPSRGAWIEILLWVLGDRRNRVAPLTGCVD